LPLGIDAQTLSHETTQLSRDDEAEWRRLTVGGAVFQFTLPGAEENS